MGADLTQSVRPIGRSRSLPNWAGPFGHLLLVGLAYAGAAKAGAELATVSGVSAVWPAAGVAVAGLLVVGIWAWPAVLISGYLETITNSISPPVALGAAAGQTLAAVVAVVLLRRARFDRSLSRLEDVLALVFLGAFASSLVAAAFGPTAFALGGYVSRHDFAVAWFTWWVGDAVGVLTVAPVFLLLGRLRAGIPSGRGLEATALLIATTVASVLLFRSTLPTIFLVFPFVLWAALRLGLPGAVGASAVVTAVAVGSTVADQGPFSALEVHSRLVSLQFFNASIVGTALLLAAVVNERRRALNDVRESRARIVQAADAERRRLERDLHDGAQQRLVSLSGTLGLTLAGLAEEEDGLRQSLGRALADAQAAQSELRSLARGIHPAVLTNEGLSAAIESLVEQAPLPVATRVSARRYPSVVEATAYFVVCEALTNMAKHARATSGRVDLHEHRGRLVVEVSDDGIGGADFQVGTGLGGLADRIAAVGGRLRIDSPPGGGTRLLAELPCG